MHATVLLAVGGRPTQNLSIFDPASPPAETIRTLFLLVVGVCAVIFVIVEGTLIYNLFRFRPKPGDNGNEPPQVYGSMPVEIAWTLAPALIVFLFILVMIRAVFEVRVDPNTPPPQGSKPLYVTVIGHQWWWEYGYDKYEGKELGFITANELHVPASTDRVVRPVYLTLKSADVCHSFWVPRLAGKWDLIPGKTNHTWFQPERTGLFLGQCAEYCGTQHANMLLRVVADTPDDFQRWADNEKKRVDDTRKRPGRDTFMKLACINCHTVRGTPAKGKFGPDLTHLMSRQTLAAGMVENNAEMLRQWVRDPQTIKVGCWMPDMKLSDREVDEVVAYLLTLR
jgi:cytochrome c oxidase subunit 2